MNQRNVEALCVLMDEFYNRKVVGDNVSLQEFLAARGVLVPAVITDEEVNAAFGVEFTETTLCHVVPRMLRDFLGRVARGGA